MSEGKIVYSVHVRSAQAQRAFMRIRKELRHLDKETALYARATNTSKREMDRAAAAANKYAAFLRKIRRARAAKTARVAAAAQRELNREVKEAARAADRYAAFLRKIRRARQAIVARKAAAAQAKLNREMREAARAADRYAKFLRKIRRARQARTARKAAAAQALLNQRWKAAGALMRMVPGRLALIAGGMGIVGIAAVSVALQITAVAKAIQFTLTEFSGFQNELLKAGTAMGEFSASNMKELSKSIMDVAGTTRFTAKEVAGGAREWFRAGRGLEEFKKTGAKAITTLAALSDQSPDQAAKALIKMMSQFGLTTDDTAEAINRLVAVSINTPASVKDLGQAMKFVGGMMKQAGVGFKETVTLVGALSTRLEAGQAARGLRTMMMNMLKPGDTARKTIEKLGISLDDFRNKMKNPVDFGKMLKGISPDDMAKIFPSTRGLLVAQTLRDMAGAGGELERVFNAVGQSGKGLADAMIEVQDLGLENQFKIMWSQVTKAAAAIGEELTPAALALLDSLVELAKSVGANADGFANWLRWGLRVAKAFVEMVDMVVVAIGWWDDFAKGIEKTDSAMIKLVKTARDLLIFGYKLTTLQWIDATEMALEAAGAFSTEAEAADKMAKAAKNLQIQMGGLVGLGQPFPGGADFNDNPFFTDLKNAREVDRERTAAAKKYADEQERALKAIREQIRSSQQREEISGRGITKGFKTATNRLFGQLNKVADIRAKGGKAGAAAGGLEAQAVNEFATAMYAAIAKNPEIGEQAGRALSAVISNAGQHMNKYLDVLMPVAEAGAAAQEQADADKMAAKIKKEVLAVEKEHLAAMKKFQKDADALGKRIEAARKQVEKDRLSTQRKLWDEAVKNAEAWIAEQEALVQAAKDLASAINDAVQAAVGIVMSTTPTSDLMTAGGNALVGTGDPTLATIGVFMNALAPFIAQVESLSIVGEGLSAMWENMAVNVFPMLEGPLLVVAGMMAVIAPLFQTLAVVLELLNPVILALGIIISGVAMGINLIILGILKMVDGFLGLFNGGAGNAAVREAIAGVEDSVDQQERAFIALATGTVDDLLQSMVDEKAARDESTESLREMNEELTNFPSGFKKLKYRQFQSTRAEAGGFESGGTFAPGMGFNPGPARRGTRGIFENARLRPGRMGNPAEEV